jgi:nickel-dependent lactate racemase
LSEKPASDRYVYVKIPYGKENMEIRVPEKNFAGCLDITKIDADGPEVEILTNALEKPGSDVTFKDFIKDTDDILIIVNDATRPTPTARVMDILLRYIADKNLSFLVATGAHRAPTEDELEYIFGPHLKKYRHNIRIHDSRNIDEMEYIGTSRNGTPMYLNRLALDAHKIVIIGSVEPHYYAGYTGGRKALLPGIAGYETIEKNHRHALKSEAAVVALEGNPVHEDMADARSALKHKEIFSVQVVLNASGRVYAAIGGSLEGSFKKAVKKAGEVFCIRIPCKTEIVVTAAPYPMDIDLYQSHKALEHGKLALKDGGIIILVSKCRAGVGDDVFVELLKRASDPRHVLKKIDGDYKLGFHKAAKIAGLAMRSEIWAATGLDHALLRDIFIKPVESAQAAVDEALKEKGPDAKILFIPHGSVTVPLVGSS